MARSCKEIDADLIRFHAQHFMLSKEGVDARAALLNEILAKVSDEATNIGEITHLFQSMRSYWGVNRSDTIDKVVATACSNPIVDAEFWFGSIVKLHVYDTIAYDTDLNFTIALSNPFMFFFLENVPSPEIYTGPFRRVITVLYRNRFSSIVSKETFFQAFDQWKASSSMKKEMGKLASRKKRQRHWKAAATDLLDAAMEASSSSLVGQVGMLLAFDTLLDRAYLASDQAPQADLPRCRSLDKLRKLISGEE